MSKEKEDKYIAIRLKGTDKFIADCGDTAPDWLIEGIAPYLCEGVVWATTTDDTDEFDVHDLIRDVCASYTDVRPDQFELVEVRVEVAPRYAITAIEPKWFRKLVKKVDEELRERQRRKRGRSASQSSWEGADSGTLPDIGAINYLSPSLVLERQY